MQPSLGHGARAPDHAVSDNLTEGIAMTIAITGGTGKLGRMAAEFALESVAASDLVVTTRTPENLAGLTARGADVRFADFDRPDSLRSALDGVDQLLVVSASNATGKRHDEHSAAVAAARAAGVRRILFTSMPNVDDHSHPSGLVADEYRDAEQMIAASGLLYTILRVAPYAELNAVERFVLFTEAALVGMVIARYVLMIDPLASAAADDVVALWAPTLRAIVVASCQLR
jgi:uncharacterized protein YbjT (DUF2867 family)